MRRAIVYFVLPLIVAAASLYNLVAYRLQNLVRPSWPAEVTNAFYAAAGVIVVFTALAMLTAKRGKGLRRTVLAVSIVVVALAGFAPRVADVLVSSAEQAQQQAEGADAEMEFQSAYLDRSDDVEQRIEGKLPYTPDEALDLLEFAVDSDLTWRSLPDHSPEAFALVRQALDAGILDPNALTTSSPTADSPAVTVTLAFYDKRIRPTSPHTVEKHAWNLLRLLVQHGADTSSPDASALRADLARTVVPGEGRYIELR
jgi:hypothetical protein